MKELVEHMASMFSSVMRGLDPRIHGAARVMSTWIAGSSPAMTARGGDVGAVLALRTTP
jgi:hypothetical protein